MEGQTGGEYRSVLMRFLGDDADRSGTTEYKISFVRAFLEPDWALSCSPEILFDSNVAFSSICFLGIS